MKAFARLCEFWIEGDVCELIIKANDGTLRVRFEQIERSDAFARFLSGCRPNAKLFDFMDLTKLLFRNNSGSNSAKIGFQLKVENAGAFNLRFSSITISPGLDETTPGTTIDSQNHLDQFFASRDQGTGRQAEATKPREYRTLVTNAHRCQQCSSALRDADDQQLTIGKKRSTVDCQHCQKRTSVYATLYCCQACNQILESPTRMISNRIKCPSCNCKQLAPHPDLLTDPQSTGEDEQNFQISCPSCESEWGIKKAHVGAWVVCSACLASFAAPQHGRKISEKDITSDVSGIQVLRKCRRCSNKIPIASTICPYCRINLPIEPASVS